MLNNKMVGKIDYHILKNQEGKCLKIYHHVNPQCNDIDNHPLACHQNYEYEFFNRSTTKNEQCQINTSIIKIKDSKTSSCPTDENLRGIIVGTLHDILTTMVNFLRRVISRILLDILVPKGDFK